MLLMIGCSSPEQKAKNLIKKHLKETLDDWNSYEPVKFGTLDSVYTTYNDIPEYQDLRRKYYSASVEYDELIEQANNYIEEARKYIRYRDIRTMYLKMASDKMAETEPLMDTMQKYAPVIDSIKKSYVPKLKGWSLTHSFRSNNKYGNKIIRSIIFFYDTDITSIVDTYESE